MNYRILFCVEQPLVAHGNIVTQYSILANLYKQFYGGYLRDHASEYFHNASLFHNLYDWLNRKLNIEYLEQF